MKKNNEPARIRYKSMLLHFTIHSVLGIVLCILFALAFSLLLVTEKIQMTSLDKLTYISTAAGAFFSSVFSSSKFGKPLFTAFVQSLMYFCILYLIGTILYSRLIPNVFVFNFLVACLIGALLGAIAVALLKKRTH